jgi:hypothetical protein
MKRKLRKTGKTLKAKRPAKHGPSARVAAGTCACGCGEQVKPGSKFRPGHDARLRPSSAWRAAHPELFESRKRNSSGGAQ